MDSQQILPKLQEIDLHPVLDSICKSASMFINFNQKFDVKVNRHPNH